MRLILTGLLLTSLTLSACSSDVTAEEETHRTSFDLQTLASTRFIGRYDRSDGYPRASWSGTGAETQVTGNEINVRLNGASGVYFEVIVDGASQGHFVTAGGEAVYALASWSSVGQHTVEINRRNEGAYGIVGFLGFESSGTLSAPENAVTRRIEYIGDSLTCGYGIEGESASCTASSANESAYSTYAAVAARTLGAQASLICLSGAGVARNYNGSTTNTMPALYERTLTTLETPTWDFNSATADVVVINLGTNDIYGGATDSEFVSSYKSLIASVRGHYPDALIVAVTWEKWGSLKEALVTQSVTESADTHIEQIQFTENAAEGYGCDWHTNVTTNARLGSQLSERLKERLGW